MKFGLRVISQDLKKLDVFEKTLLLYCKDISNLQVVKLPTEIKKVVLVKSPHVFKKSKEHFAAHSYKRLFYFTVDKALVLYYIKLITTKTMSGLSFEFEYLDAK